MSPPSSYCEVLVDLPHEQFNNPFHYRIPPELQDDIGFGAWVEVPFGRRREQGYVVGFVETPDVEKTRDIIDILNPGPLFTPNLYHLARWMALHYVCPVSTALGKMIPAGIKKKLVCMVSLAFSPEKRDEVLATLSNAPRQREALQILLESSDGENRVLPKEELVDQLEASSPGGILRRLSEKGLIRINYEVQQARVRKKKIRVVRPVGHPKKVRERISELNTRAPKQAAVLRVLLDQPVPLQVSELARAADTTSGTVRRLKEKGYIEYEHTVSRRSPHPEREKELEVPPELTGEQEAALTAIRDALSKRRREGFLLHGVTGSGKTEVYIRAIRACLKEGRRALLLVPEIALTPQILASFRRRFSGEVAVLTSGLAEGERYDEWRRIREGEARIVIGTRSAIFAPLQDIGLIVIDEEHDTSYKEGSPPCYHVFDVAEKRAEMSGAVLVCGSATPSLEIYHRVGEGQIRLLELTSRIASRPLPAVEIVDMRKELKEGNKSIFSRELSRAISSTMERDLQVLLFLNRRGFSTFVLCRDCGQALNCPRCDVSLTYHASQKRLRCHYCDFSRRVPETCPACAGSRIRFFGTGTEKIVEAVRGEFPEAEVDRMDVDTTRRLGSHAEILDGLRSGETDILVGTQMIAKGHDIETIGLVGVIAADTALNFPDFRAAEQTFQLITQVAGRTGRGHERGRVIVQTYSPEHYSIQSAQGHDYHRFYEREIEARRSLNYPPFSELICITLKHPSAGQAERSAKILKTILSTAFNKRGLLSGIEILGPNPAPLAQIRSLHRWQLVLRGSFSGRIRRLLAAAKRKLHDDIAPDGLRIVIDVDPRSML